MIFPNFLHFFELCHDEQPYPWQCNLASSVIANGAWPDALDLPTASGKTSVIDIALYALASAAHKGELDAFPRRMFLVVDRRVLVDQAYQRGTRLLNRINDRVELEPLKAALRTLSPSEPPQSIRLRGACPTDLQWCRSVDQVQIIASTVDQIGSRLLLRGYGVSPSMRSIEAGLVGQDSIVFLDEAHLSGPFLSTLNHLNPLNPVRSITPRRQVVSMSATFVPTQKRHEIFRLGEEDFNHKRLALRLDATKQVRWTESKIRQILDTIDASCVLMIANTIRTALAWFKEAAKTTIKSNKQRLENREIFLVTGRMRPVDRKKVLDSVESSLNDRRPIIVVATQCVEAGVDWDFDSMISECASWDALVQRMGRVNRCGNHRNAECFILPAQRTTKASSGSEKLCPVYREQESNTANWLSSVLPFSCTPGSMPTPPQGCVRPLATAPTLISEYLDLWSQNRADGPAFDVSVFLHGIQEESEVQVIWRNIDLSRDRLHLEQLFKALPPSSLEAIQVPLRDVREWLGDRSVVHVSDDVQISSAMDTRIGDTLIVPVEYGGIGSHGTFDRSPETASDVSEIALSQHRNILFQFHDFPRLSDDEPISEQINSWIDQDETRRELKNWTWIDLGHRLLFVSDLPIESDDDGPSFQRQKISLESHLNGVEKRTLDVCERLGLSPHLTSDLALAAKLHDFGKLDDRFQRLCGRVPGTVPLGKSNFDWVVRGQRAKILDYPKGERHEALSTELMIRYGLHKTAHDPELVEHLVASHHGWARPFIRDAQGTAKIHDQLYNIEFSTELVHEEAHRSPSRFRSVQERFGWHGLAWLEAILRLSDHRQSEAEQRGQVFSMGGDLPNFQRKHTSSRSIQTELELTTFNGLIPGDFLATLGVLRALALTEEEALLRWEGTLPCIKTKLEIDEVVDRLIDARRIFRGTWPNEINKLSDEECSTLIRTSREPFRSLVVALISPGGGSDMDFVSGGRSSFKTIFDWSTNPDTKEFSRDSLRLVFTGPRNLTKKGKSFRWTPLAAQGARRPQSASNDMRTEPWIEWLSLLGVASLVSVPEVRRGRLATRSTSVFGFRLDSKTLHWPLWRIALCCSDVSAALASNRFGLHDALWCEAPRLVFGTTTNRAYGLGAGRLL